MSIRRIASARTPLRRCLLMAGMLLAVTPLLAQPLRFSFGVIAPGGSRTSAEAHLREAIDASDADSLAFVVVNGIKAPGEPCSDKLYFRRKELFQSAKNGLFVAIAASDWSACQMENGRSTAMERLGRVRDLFFGDDFSFGGSRLPLVRQAMTPKYRSYAENLRWDVGNIIFATLNLPANNNDFLPAAGRNAEFDDRMIADRDWLHRVFVLANQRNAAGIVLFCDGDPLAPPDGLTRIGFGNGRDGFAEIRKQLQALSLRFPGKVLVVHGSGATGGSTVHGIVWRANLASVGAGSGWQKIVVEPGTATLFSLGATAALLPVTAQ